MLTSPHLTSTIYAFTCNYVKDKDTWVGLQGDIKDVTREFFPVSARGLSCSPLKGSIQTRAPSVRVPKGSKRKVPRVVRFRLRPTRLVGRRQKCARDNKKRQIFYVVVVFIKF